MKKFAESRSLSLNQPAIAIVPRQFPRPVAELTIVLDSGRKHKTRGEPSPERKVGIVPVVAAGVAMFITLLIVSLGTSYLYGMLLAKIQSMQYNQTQAQYSNVWKWQR